MAQNLTANPAVNDILARLNHSYVIEGRPQITEASLNEMRESVVLSAKHVPMQGLIHIAEGRGMSSKEIEKAYLAQKPSIFKIVSLRIQSAFK